MAESLPETNLNQTYSNDNSYEVITEELVRDGLQNDKSKNAKLLSWEIKDFTNKGDGYTSIVTSITVKYINNNIQLVDSYVVKLNPQRPPGLMTDWVKQIFPREIEILANVTKTMSKHLETFGLVPLRTPRLFSSTLEKGREVFVAENLRTQGFQMPDKRKGQDFHHAILVMEELGRFHASSLFLKESIAPKSFGDTYEYFEEPFFEAKGIFLEVFGTSFTSQAEAAINFLDAIPEYEKCVKWLNVNKQNMCRYFIEGYKSNKPFEVLVHGDCWANNLLFKYNSNNIPVDMRFVDLQGCRLASPASDINYYMYSSVTVETRSKHFQKMLNTYYESFSKVLYLAQKEVPFTFKDLENEIASEKRMKLGLVIGMMTIPGSFLGQDDEVTDYGEIRNDNEEVLAKKQKQKFHEISEREELFKYRFLSLFDDMFKSHIFDEN